MLIDTHCHLDFPCFTPLSEKIKVWQAQGVGGFVVPSVGPQNWQSVLELNRYPNIAVGLGIHPCFKNGFTAVDNFALQLEKYCDQLAAIGECGLDGRFKDTYSQQRVIFIRQLQLAASFNLPVIIHSVRANDDVYSLLRHYPVPKGGVIHAFQGSFVQAQRFVDLGFKLGIGGAFVWPRSEKLRKIVTKLPIESIVFETDAPDMPLPGMSKGENTPLSILQVVKMAGQVLQMDEDLLSEFTYKNSVKLFNLMSV
ncbi:MAG: putative metal-dependent hydrolase YjjV [Candidatus Celerinatantimonas neptuna]|nr:MAG: putative metal-dependent hydrolase YjjV [Candidatus Celerinatantimonas neptuna]